MSGSFSTTDSEGGGFASTSQLHLLGCKNAVVPTETA
jgi:hypothetical protein